MKLKLDHINRRCDVVQTMYQQGQFDLDELALHIASCPTCQSIQNAVSQTVKQAVDKAVAERHRK
jgi:hypothetical protein